MKKILIGLCIAICCIGNAIANNKIILSCEGKSVYPKLFNDEKANSITGLELEINFTDRTIKMYPYGIFTELVARDNSYYAQISPRKSITVGRYDGKTYIIDQDVSKMVFWGTCYKATQRF